MAKRTAPLSLILFFFCITAPLPALAGGMPVFVSIAPQQYFLQQIGGELVSAQVMVPPGADPHTYEPKPSQMVALAKAKIYFAIGVPFEKTWLDKFSAASPEMLIVHTEKGIDKIPMAAHAHPDEGEPHHEAEHHGEAESGSGAESAEHQAHRHHAGELDPHTWLAPPLVKIQARNILDALVVADPAHAAAYRANFAAFNAQLDAMDAEFKRIFAGKRGMKFLVFHPAWGYFAKAYDLQQIPVEVEGKDPKPAELMKLIEDARKEGIKVVFVQPQFSTRSADAIAKAIGGEVVFADPLGADWAANLRQVAAKFEAALK